MKVIDLLNKIANGDEMPKKITYRNIDYYWTGYTYENSEACEVFFWDCICNEQHLNEEVEFIEEDKKIKTIKSFTLNVGAVDENNIEEYIHKLFEQEFILYSKIIEIIDVINRGDKD